MLDKIRNLPVLNRSLSYVSSSLPSFQNKIWFSSQQNSEGPKQNAAPPENSLNEPDISSYSDIKKNLAVGGIVVASAGAAVIAPYVIISAVGFGSGGILSGSLAAGMMSTAATTGHGMAVVSALQSIGAAGLALSTKSLIGTAGAYTGYKLTSHFKPSIKGPEGICAGQN